MASIESISKLFLLTVMIASCSIVNNEGSEQGTGTAEVYKETREIKLSPDDYVQYIKSPESGLILTKKEKHMFFTAQYQPVDYCMLMETGMSYSKAAFDSLRQDYNGGSYFRIEITEQLQTTYDSTVTLTHLKNNQQLSEYFGYKVQNDLLLVQNNDTIPCQMSHLIDYGTSNRMIILCVFPKLKNEDAVVLWNDPVIFNKTHSFQFRKENIQYINSVNVQL